MGGHSAGCNGPTLLIADIPVIVISGADTHRFDELAAAASFEKPVQMSNVLTLLRELLPDP
jgi:hypothetical protein